MQLKRYTDYSLRVLLYLGAHPGRISSVSEIARAYGISHNHLLKVVKGLTEQKLIHTYRGKSGGMQLARPAQDINVGEIVQRMEGRDPIVNCREPACPILPACTLTKALARAQEAFWEVLDSYSLADLLQGKSVELARLLATNAARGQRSAGDAP